MRLSRGSEPQPDIAVLPPRPDAYSGGHPAPEDIFLLVELADTSLEYDRRTKMPLYARHGIPEVWLVDLIQNTTSSYRDPAGDGYRTNAVHGPGDRIRLLAFPDLQFNVGEILD